MDQTQFRAIRSWEGITESFRQEVGDDWRGDGNGLSRPTSSISIAYLSTSNKPGESWPDPWENHGVEKQKAKLGISAAWLFRMELRAERAIASVLDPVG